MAIHDLWDFENAPIGLSLLSGQSNVTPNVYTQATGLPGLIYTLSGSTTVTSDGFLTLTRGTNGEDSPLIVAANLVQNFTTSTKFWMGFRTKANYATTSSTAGKLLCSESPFAGNALQVFVNEADVVAAANTEVYVEIFFDTVALSYQLWVNGTLLRTAAIAAGAVVSSMFWQIGTGGTATVASTARGFRDFYFLDVDATDTNRLGPIRSSLATITAAAASEWTLNGSPASLLAALNTPLQNPLLATPSATSSSDNQPLVLTLSTALPASTPIIAIQPMVSAASSSSAPGNLDVSYEIGAQSTDAGSIALPSSTMTYNNRLPPVRTSPTGGAWTVAEINELEMVLTP